MASALRRPQPIARFAYAGPGVRGAVIMGRHPKTLYGAIIVKLDRRSFPSPRSTQVAIISSSRPSFDWPPRAVTVMRADMRQDRLGSVRPDAVLEPQFARVPAGLQRAISKVGNAVAAVRKQLGSRR